MLLLNHFHISGGDIEDSINKGKRGDISFDFNALKGYDKHRFAFIKAAV